MALFLLAAATGALLRFGMLYGLPDGLHLQNVRHAHSHLMYFGWATPAFMALIWARLPALSGRAPKHDARGVIGLTFGVALLAYLAFMRYGYQPAQIGPARLPLSTIGAGLNVLAWYAFGALYWRATRGAPRYMPLRLGDAALVFMGLASLGAWGLALATAFDVQSPVVSMALTHLFLDLFADGWFLLAILGAAFLSFPGAASKRAARIGENLLIFGLPLTFLLNLPGGALPPLARAVIGLSAVCAGLGLLAVLYALGASLKGNPDQAQRRLWAVALFFLSLKAVAFLVVASPEGAAWSLRMGLRISYLHWLLLGGVSLGLMAAARACWGDQSVLLWRPLVVTIFVLLGSLIPLTRFWPAGMGGRWTLEFAAWATLGPTTVLFAMLLKKLLDGFGPQRVAATGNNLSKTNS